MKPLFFASAAEWRAWLDAHHDRADEVLVGFHKRATGRPSLTWSESVDEALCFGWIDGIRRRVDADRYSIRFTPRRRGSTWSAVNLRKVQELRRRGLMRPAGLRAHAARRHDRTGRYSFEQRKAATLPAAFEKRLRANKAAWRFFNAQPPWYRRTAVWWIVSALREETRKHRLETLIEDSAVGRRVGPVRRTGEGG